MNAALDTFSERIDSAEMRNSLRRKRKHITKISQAGRQCVDHAYGVSMGGGQQVRLARKF